MPKMHVGCSHIFSTMRNIFGMKIQIDLHLFSGSLGRRYFHGHGTTLRALLSLTKPKLRPSSRQRHTSTSKVPEKRIKSVFVATRF